MDRRRFLTGAFALAAIPALRRSAGGAAPVHLEAFVNAGMPWTLVLAETAPLAAIFELRAYGEDFRGAELLPRLLREAGAECIIWGPRTYLIAFAGLGERADAWAEVNTHPQWRGMGGGYRFGLYRRLSGAPA